jgi:nucleoside-diphosphate-sugar epimerase
MKVLITGAAGYIGRYLTWKLEGRHELRLADQVEPDPTRIPWVYLRHEVEPTPEHTPPAFPSLPFLVGDILDPEFCRRITEGVDAVVHLAGHVKGIEEPIECFLVNAAGTHALLQACAENGVARALVASSINASGWFYGRSAGRGQELPYLPVDEAIPVDYEDAYSLAKHCNELNCAAISRRVGMTTAAFRFAGVYPPELVERYRERVRPTTEWPVWLGSYVDLRDVVQGVIQALECASLPQTGVYQLSAPDTLLPEPTLEIIERFRPELLDRLHAPLPRHASMLSSARAQETFAYQPRHSWRGDDG